MRQTAIDRYSATDSSDSTFEIYADQDELDDRETGFLTLIEDELNFNIGNVYEAKGGNEYRAGKYYPYDLSTGMRNDKHTITVPDNVQDILQWGCPDVIIASGESPILSIETTSHKLRWNNVAQRVPRQLRAAKLGVPNVIFQRVDSYESDDPWINWFCEIFRKATKIHGTSSLAIPYVESDREKKAKQLAGLCNYFATGYEEETLCEVQEEMEKYTTEYDEETLLKGKSGDPRSFVDKSDHVTCTIGVKPDGSGWDTKGTGNLDPYPGLVKMIEILCCYEGKRKKRKLVTHFSNLPEDFPWFRERSSLYLDLIEEFSDEISHTDEQIYETTTLENWDK